MDTRYSIELGRHHVGVTISTLLLAERNTEAQWNARLAYYDFVPFDLRPTVHLTGTCFHFSRNTINYDAVAVPAKIMDKKGKQTNHE